MLPLGYEKEAIVGLLGLMAAVLVFMWRYGTAHGGLWAIHTFVDDVFDKELGEAKLEAFGGLTSVHSPVLKVNEDKLALARSILWLIDHDRRRRWTKIAVRGAWQSAGYCVISSGALCIAWAYKFGDTLVDSLFLGSVTIAAVCFVASYQWIQFTATHGSPPSARDAGGP